MPMYASSPAKRKVIDAQLKTWFEQGIIEPSQSPWGAPVVIIYRNGKARFCVDYRKLNALTMPDEFYTATNRGSISVVWSAGLVIVGRPVRLHADRNRSPTRTWRKQLSERTEVCSNSEGCRLA